MKRKAAEDGSPQQSNGGADQMVTPMMSEEIGTPRGLDANSARWQYLEAKRGQGRMHADSDTTMRGSVRRISTGALVEEGDLLEDSGVLANPDDDASHEQDWIDEEECAIPWNEDSIHAAKVKRLIEVVEGNEMFMAIRPHEVLEGALRLGTTFALADREDEAGNIVLKARLCARDFAKGKKRLEVFAPSSSPITSKIVDLKAVEENLLRVTFGVTAAYHNYSSRNAWS